GLESPLQASFFSRRLLSAAGTERARTEMASLQAEIAARGISAAGLEILSKHLAEALRRVEQAARREVERQMQARTRRAKASWSERPFQTLSPREMEHMKNAVRLLAQKLKTRLTRKHRNYRRGALSVHRTLRKNLACGAIPMVPVFRKRMPDRPDLVVLCDVSDSVRNVSRMMLLFMYTLQELFKRVRSFVFVSEIGEVTKEFGETPVEEAIDLATAGKAISLHANSNYGNALQRFAREQIGSIGRKTTVMIIGDGRNNYHPNQAWALQELRRKSRRLLWICSEDRRNWGFGDSEMLTYARFCDQVVVVQSLDDLTRVADQLVPAR